MDRKLPLYKCHKQVRAGEIVMIDRGETSRLYFGELDVAYVDVTREWMDKNRPQVGGYFVEYEDGYQSYSPAKAFNEGYTRLRNRPTDAVVPTKVTREALSAKIARAEYVVMPDGRTTICQLTMANGFTVRGESSCVSAENFNKELGEKYAFDKAFDAAWAFEGYLLAEMRTILA